MTEAIRFHIITDEPECALIDLFCCTPATAPSWVRTVTDPSEILNLPDGSKCRAQWYSRSGRTLADRAWRERRLMGGLDFISSEDEDRINVWIDRRNAARQERLAPAIAIRRQEPEIQNLPLTQRWS
jgi:hypothetical protein